MAAQLSTKLTMDGTQHNDALRGAAKELSKYKREVENTDKQLKMFKQQSQSATGAVNTFATSFKNGNVQGMMIGAEGATKALGGTLVKLGGWFGVAMGATEAFSKSINSSQIAIDTYGTVQTQVTTVVDNFFTALTTGDFSSFLNGIDSITAKAREAYQTLDDLWNMSQSFGAKTARLDTNFQSNLIQMRKLKGSTNPNDKKEYDRLKAENERIISEQAKDAQKMYNKEFDAIRVNINKKTNIGFNPSNSVISEVLESDIDNLKKNRSTFQKQYNEYLSKVDELQKKHSKKLAGQGLLSRGAAKINAEGNLGASYTQELISLQNKYGKAIVATTVLNKMNDKELEEQVNHYKQAYSYKQKINSLDSKMVRYEKETPTSGGGSNSGKGGRSGGSNTQKYAEGSVGWYDEQIALKQKEIKFQVDSSEIERLQKEIKDLISLKEQLMNPIKPFAQVELPKIPNIAEQLIPKFDAENLPKLNIPSIVDQYDEIRDKMSRVFDSYDMGIIGAKKAQEFIDELNAQLEALGLKPIKIHVESDAERTLGDISEVAGQMGDAFSGLGEAMNLPELDAAGIISGTIASVLQGYGTATAQASTLGPWAWIAFAIAGMAQVATMISQIHSLSGYAGGGVIQGRTTIGDYNFARVNAGEMILNTKQQNHLFKMIDEGRTGLHQSMGGEVIFRIHGKDLEGVRRNYNDKMNKVR